MTFISPDKAPFFNRNVLIFFLFLKICCVYSLEALHRCASNKHPQLFLGEICLGWGFMAQSTQWGHVEGSQFAWPHFYGQAQSSKWLTSTVHTLSPKSDNCLSWISGRERMTIENISWSVSKKECCWPGRGRTHILLITRTRHQGRLFMEK